MSIEIAHVLRRAEALIRAGRRAALCVIVRARGSTPQSAGSLMLVDDDAGLSGTVGGGCVEAEARRRAHDMLSRGETGVLRFRLDSDYGWDDGLICGGTVEIAVTDVPDAERLSALASAIERGESCDLTLRADTARFRLRIPARERLVIAGAGHIGQALARIGITLGFAVTLADDRDDLLHAVARDGVTPLSGDIAESLRALDVGERTFAVVVTRGHRHDEQALAALVGRGAAYVGMIGSRRKVKLITDDLVARGVDPLALAAVHAPIGLPIGAVTVEEIAVSIAAQLVAVRRAAQPAPVQVTLESGHSTRCDSSRDSDAA